MAKKKEVLCDESAVDDTSLGGHGDGTKERTSDSERERPLHTSPELRVLYIN